MLTSQSCQEVPRANARKVLCSAPELCAPQGSVMCFHNRVGSPLQSSSGGLHSSQASGDLFTHLCWWDLGLICIFFPLGPACGGGVGDVGPLSQVLGRTPRPDHCACRLGGDLQIPSYQGRMKLGCL